MNQNVLFVFFFFFFFFFCFLFGAGLFFFSLTFKGIMFSYLVVCILLSKMISND